MEKFGRLVPVGVVIGLLSSCPGFTAMAQQAAPVYIEPGYDPRFYLGDADTRLGWAHLVRGDYGLAEQYYRRAVEANRQNGSAWIGLAAAYDRLGAVRFGGSRLPATAVRFMLRSSLATAAVSRAAAAFVIASGV
jgi:tetratricopeptide (TPR) repeat protein